MQDKEMLKAFGVRLKTLRKQKKWTQKEVAAKLDIGFSQFNKRLYIPLAEKLVLLAELFNTTIDYLLTCDNVDARALHNVRLLEQFRGLWKISSRMIKKLS